MNNEYNEIINQLKSNINEIITLYEKEKELNKNFKNEIEILKNKIDSIENNSKEIEKKYNNLKIAKQINKDSDSSNEAKMKLNRMIREVDNCIALINK